MLRIILAIIFFFALIWGCWSLVMLSGLVVNPALFKCATAHLAQEDFTTGCFMAMLVSCAVAGFCSRFREWPVYLGAWACKLTLTLLVMLVYEQKYEVLDAYGYFDIASALVSVPGHGAPWVSGTDFVSHFLAGIFQFIPVSYHGAKVVFASIGLLGSLFFYEALFIVTGRRSLAWCALLTCFPPILFWGSILGKDPLMFMMLGAFCWLSMTAMASKKLLVKVPALAAALVIGMLTGVVREWAPKIFVPALLMILALTGVPKLRVSAGVRMLAFACMAALLITGPGWYRLPDWMATQRDTLYYFRDVLAYGGSSESVPFVLLDWEDFFAYLPYGMFSALFRPFVFDVPSLFGMVSGVMNLSLLMLVSYCSVMGSLPRARAAQFGFYFLTCVVWSAVYGFISPANLGMGTRFQLQVLPFMISACAMLLESPAIVRGDHDLPRPTRGLLGA